MYAQSHLTILLIIYAVVLLTFLFCWKLYRTAKKAEHFDDQGMDRSGKPIAIIWGIFLGFLWFASPFLPPSWREDYLLIIPVVFVSVVCASVMVLYWNCFRIRQGNGFLVRKMLRPGRAQLKGELHE